MHLKSLVGDRAFYKSVLAIALPVMIQNCITNFVNLIDNIMVGSLSTEAMSGVAIVNQFIFVFNLAVFGAVSAAGIFTAQYSGRDDHDGVRHTFRAKLMIASILTVLCSAIFLLFDDALVSSFLHEGTEGDLKATLAYGKEYLLYVVIGFLPYAISQSYASTMRETGNTVLPMIASIASVLTNLVFNSLLIFGLFGFPALGVAGAAIATSLSRLIELVILVLYAHTHTDKHPCFKHAFRSMRVPLPLMKRIAIKGMPILLNELLWSLSITLRNQCYSTRGLEVVAALNIATTVINLLSVMHHSIGSTVAIMIGNLLGGGKLEEARDTNKKLLAFAAFMGAVVGVVQIALAPFFPYLYNTEAAVREMATGIMITYAFFIPSLSFALACYYTLRSGGKVFVTFLFDCGYAWCIVTPVAFAVTYLTSLPVIPIYAITLFAEATKCIVGFIIVKRGRWLKQLS